MSARAARELAAGCRPRGRAHDRRLSILLALAAAAVFGTGDFLGGLACRRTAALFVLLLSQAVGLSGMAALAAALGGAPSGFDLVAGAAAGLSGGAGVAMLYRGLATGAMAVVAPVTGVVAAVVPVVAGIAGGEHPAPLQLAGIGVAIVAVALLGGGPRAESRLQPLTLLLAVGSGVCFGIFYIALAKTSTAAGLWPLVAARGASVTAFAIGLAAVRPRARFGRSTAWIIAGAGVFDVGANALYLVAVHTGLLSVVAVLVSLYPAATAACSLAFLGERLRALQLGGAGLAAAAVVLVSAG